MKKITLTLVFLLAIGFSSIAKNPNFLKPKIKIWLDIGKQSANCDRFSICSIGISIEGRTATATLDDDDNLILIIPADLVEIHSRDFENGNMPFDTDFALPDDVNARLEAREPIVINKGNYRINKDEDNNYIIVFK